MSHDKWVKVPRQPRRLRAGLLRFNAMKCRTCGVPIIFVFHQEREIFVPVLLAQEGRLIFDWNPFYDRTVHKLHGYCSYLVKKHAAETYEADVKAALKKVGPEESAGPGEGEEPQGEGA